MGFIHIKGFFYWTFEEIQQHIHSIDTSDSLKMAKIAATEKVPVLIFDDFWPRLFIDTLHGGAKQPPAASNPKTVPSN